ncbi:MAG: hypothetical protein KDD66_04120 [Bdellovibrionales bacterium]|nr:hypothetical protein [Bdellovibrionales bacterium]
MSRTERGAALVDYVAVIACGLTIALCAVAGTPSSPGLQDNAEQVFLSAAYALGGSTESTKGTTDGSKGCPEGVKKDGVDCGSLSRD